MNKVKDYATKYATQSAKAFVWFLQTKLGLDICRTVVKEDDEIDLSSLTQHEMNKIVAEFSDYYKKCLDNPNTVP